MGTDTKRILSETWQPEGFILRVELVEKPDWLVGAIVGGDKDPQRFADELQETLDDAPEFMEIERAYTLRDDYIGDVKTARFLCGERGIAPELRDPKHKVCSIGFCAGEQKWYGWSHRAICGFGVGDVVKEGDCAATSGWVDEYLEEHPEADLSLPVGFVAETLADAKRMAIAFADSVS